MSVLVRVKISGIQMVSRREKDSEMKNREKDSRLAVR
jgi:hypothetical protein